jgi:hypothetical protein
VIEDCTLCCSLSKANRSKDSFPSHCWTLPLLAEFSWNSEIGWTVVQQGIKYDDKSAWNSVNMEVATHPESWIYFRSVEWSINAKRAWNSFQ